MTVERTAVKNFNPDLFMQELKATILNSVFSGISWAGFEASPGGRRYTPIASPRKIGERNEGGVITEDWADPGEMRFHALGALSGAEDTALDTVISAHDATSLTVEQQRKDTDDADFQTLKTAYVDWDTLTAAQRWAATRIMARLVLREGRSETV
jgi:hypothetical protein